MNTFALNSRRNPPVCRHVTEPPPISVAGVRCQFDNWLPVIVNREAEAEALMAWGVCQLEAANQLIKVIASSPTAADAGAIAGAIGHLTGQAETVIRAALQVHRDSFID